MNQSLFFLLCLCAMASGQEIIPASTNRPPDQQRVIVELRQATTEQKAERSNTIEKVGLSILGIVSSILAAFLSAHLTTKKFLHDKLWDKKDKAYSEIMDTLYDILHYSELRLLINAGGNKRLPSRECIEKSVTRYSEAILKLDKVSEVGAFVISEPAARALWKLANRHGLRSTENVQESLDAAEVEIFKGAISELRKLAHADLNTK